MKQFFSLIRGCLNNLKPSVTRKAARQRGFRPGMEILERRDTPSTCGTTCIPTCQPTCVPTCQPTCVPTCQPTCGSTSGSLFAQVVTTNPPITLGAVDVLSITVNGTQYQGSGVQYGVKLASSASALPGNGVPNFYGFCVDVTHTANLSSAYQVTTASSSTLHNGAAIAYLYDTFNTPVGSPLDKTHAAALQLAIWKEEYGMNIVTAKDIAFMETPPYNGSTTAAATTETNAILNDAAYYLGKVPCNPTAIATVFSGLCNSSTQSQSMIGPHQNTCDQVPPSCFQPCDNNSPCDSGFPQNCFVPPSQNGCQSPCNTHETSCFSDFDAGCGGTDCNVTTNTFGGGCNVNTNSFGGGCW